MFVTAFSGILDLASGALVFASAGHDAPFVVKRDAPPRQLETVGGPPLGVVDDFSFPVDHDYLDFDQVLVLYTDGVTEATDGEMRLYGKDRLTTLLAVTPPDDARSVVDAVVVDVLGFAVGTEQADDIALLALRRPAAARTQTGRAVSGRQDWQNAL
jgi:sigma-B regulation protein RsbU (phosphoserine phosphatase)